MRYKQIITPQRVAVLGVLHPIVSKLTGKK